MYKSIIAAGMLAAVLVGACSPAVAAPPSATPPPAVSPAPTVEPVPSAPVDPTQPPSPAPDPTPQATERPDPTPRPTTKPKPTPVTFTRAERYLLDGIRRGAIDCEPVREKLPATAVAGIECDADFPAVARVGFYLFEDDETMLEHHFARMAAYGVEPDSGDCHDGFSEGAYYPGEGFVPFRDGCFINEAGRGNYRMTSPGDHVYIGVLGKDRDTMELGTFASLFNQDTPGGQTLWATPR